MESNELDKKNRVTAAQLAQSAPVNTSETYRRSPLSTNSISNSAQTVNTPQGNTVVENSQVAESTGNTRVRGYNESITQKTDLPTEIKNEFIS